MITMPGLTNIPDPKGVGHAFFRHMQKNKDKTAQICGIAGEKDTFGCLLERCVRTAIKMRSKGVTSNDVIALCTDNHLNSCVPFIATTFVGAKISTIDPCLSVNEVSHFLKLIEPKIVFVIPEVVEIIEEACKLLRQPPEFVVFGKVDHPMINYNSFDSFLEKCPGEEKYFKPFEAKNPKDTCVIVFSSGTSGLAKAICINHYNYLGQIDNFIEFGCSIDIILSSASLYWSTACLYLGISLLNGSCRLVINQFDPLMIWEKIHLYKPTYMFLAPTQILEMCQNYQGTIYNTSSLKDICIGGSPCSKEQIIRIRKYFTHSRVCLGYGQSEVFGYLATFKPCNSMIMDIIRDKPASVGDGVPGMSYKIVDLETEEILGPNQQGELRVKTDLKLNGYYNMDSSESLDSNGWLKTGDMAYYDDDGYFYITERIKELLKYRSYHVIPASIENVLVTHPLVKAAVVLGKPHAIDGDLPMAAVILKDRNTIITPEELEKFANERLGDKQKLRGGVKIIDCFPMTPTGKIKRRELKQSLLQMEP